MGGVCGRREESDNRVAQSGRRPTAKPLDSSSAAFRKMKTGLVLTDAFQSGVDIQQLLFSLLNAVNPERASGVAGDSPHPSVREAPTVEAFGCPLLTALKDACSPERLLREVGRFYSADAQATAHSDSSWWLRFVAGAERRLSWPLSACGASGEEDLSVCASFSAAVTLLRLSTQQTAVLCCAVPAFLQRVPTSSKHQLALLLLLRVFSLKWAVETRQKRREEAQQQQRAEGWLKQLCVFAAAEAAALEATDERRELLLQVLLSIGAVHGGMVASLLLTLIQRASEARRARGLLASGFCCPA